MISKLFNVIFVLASFAEALALKRLELAFTRMSLALKTEEQEILNVARLCAPV